MPEFDETAKRAAIDRLTQRQVDHAEKCGLEMNREEARARAVDTAKRYDYRHDE